MRGFGRLSYDFLAGTGSSFLGVSGRGTVLEGGLDLSCRWAGPWAPKPLEFLDFQAVYVTETLEIQAGRVGFSFASFLAPLGFWGLSARLSLKDIGFGYGSGWDGQQGRAGGFLIFHGDWAELGGAYREDRGDALHSQGGVVWIGLQAFEDLWFLVEAGAAQVQGLTRFAGQTGLTWEIPDLWFLEVKGYAIDPNFPALFSDRAGFRLSGRLGAEEAGFRFSCEWQRDNLRGSSAFTRAWQGLQVGWDLFPENSTSTAFYAGGMGSRGGYPIPFRRRKTLPLFGVWSGWRCYSRGVFREPSFFLYPETGSGGALGGGRETPAVPDLLGFFV